MIGVDINPANVDAINGGKAPVFEPGLEESIRSAVSSGLLSATGDLAAAVRETEISLLCVPTPNQETGELDLSFVRTALEQVGSAIREKQERHVVVMRSTVLPGTGRTLGIPILESSSGGRHGESFSYVSNPEFLREGTAIADFNKPPMTVVGADDELSSSLVGRLYEHLDAPVIATEIETAELLKYADNAWHATKVVFANEIGAIAREVGLDGQKVMEAFCLDTKLNLSPYYLKPGFAYGGSCLPKDLQALLYMAKAIGVETPLLSSVHRSNERQIDRALSLIEATGASRIAILGLSFKADTDDLRQSPQLRLAERLVERGCQLLVYDPCLNRSLDEPSGKRLRANFPQVLPWLRGSLDEVLAESELIVVGNGSREFAGIDERIGKDQILLDLVRISERRSGNNYLGICW